MEKQRSLLLDHLILKSWWVILIFLCIFFLYDQGASRKKCENQKLLLKKELLYRQTRAAQTEQVRLKREIASQRDPAWIEMVLKRRLGLVDEGERKILFKELEERPPLG